MAFFLANAVSLAVHQLPRETQIAPRRKRLWQAHVARSKQLVICDVFLRLKQCLSDMMCCKPKTQQRDAGRQTPTTPSDDARLRLASPWRSAQAWGWRIPFLLAAPLGVVSVPWLGELRRSPSKIPRKTPRYFCVAAWRRLLSSERSSSRMCFETSCLQFCRASAEEA